MQNIALIMLASGQSKRFGSNNKLLATLRGYPVAAYTAGLFRTRRGIHRIAVTDGNATELQALYRSSGWEIAINEDPSRGQSSSLSIGIRAAQKKQADMVMVCLADMPFVTEQELDALLAAMDGARAVMSRCEGVLMPPAGFTHSTFDKLLALKGDRGARSVFETLADTATLPIRKPFALDVDTPETLAALNMEPVAHE